MCMNHTLHKQEELHDERKIENISSPSPRCHRLFHRCRDYVFAGLLGNFGRIIPTHYIFTYPFYGILYGFGLTFANWKVTLQKTKQGAVEGATGLGIGVFLSHFTGEKKWGIYGWFYFIFRLCWHIGFCWIPGIWYGIQTIRKEFDDLKVASPSSQNTPPASDQTDKPSHRIFDKFNKPADRGPGKTNTPAPRPADTTDKSTRRPAAKANKPFSRPAQPKEERPAPTPAPAASTRFLFCLSGSFAGAEFPFHNAEVLTIGSDPTRSQIVLSGNGIPGEVCRLWFIQTTAFWYAVVLPGATVYRDGTTPLLPETVQVLPRGTTLSTGPDDNKQIFKLG